MDDNKFDDIIKNKLEDFGPQEFDPAALASLHHRMGALSMNTPWYQHYRNEIFAAAGVVLIALLLLWGQWQIGSRQLSLLQNEIYELRAGNTAIMDLQKEIQRLKNQVPDTVTSIEIHEQDPGQYNAILTQLNQLRREFESTKPIDHKGKVFLGADKDLPEDMIDLLILEGYAQKEGNNVYLVNNKKLPYLAHREPSNHYIPDNKILFFERPAPSIKESASSVADKTNNTNLSVRTIRDLERHYRNGIEVRVGPTLEIYQGYYSGKSTANIGAGLLADLILSPSMSLETGLKYFRRNYETIDQEDLAELNLPTSADGLGSLKSVDINYWMLELPINLKYRYPLNMETNVLIHGGYSTSLYLKEKLEYGYDLDNGADNNMTVFTNEEVNQAKLYTGTLNLGLGISHQFENKKTLETSIYYQYSLGQQGVEQASPNFFGVRGVYWIGKKGV